jgi:broad specificity phosphatase PhoE
LKKTTITRIYLIRHGETQWNVEGRYQGQADPPLNARGRAQAEQLGRQLRSQGLARLISSPLLRALQTAEILARILKLPVETEERLVEIHQGDWQTRLRSEIESRYPELFASWEADPWSVTPPGGESLRQVQARVHAAVDEILARYPGERSGVVLHRIPIALLKMRYQGLDPDSIRQLNLPNAGWEEIEI